METQQKISIGHSTDIGGLLKKKMEVVSREDRRRVENLYEAYRTSPKRQLTLEQFKSIIKKELSEIKKDIRQIIAPMEGDVRTFLEIFLDNITPTHLLAVAVYEITPHWKYDVILPTSPSKLNKIKYQMVVRDFEKMLKEVGSDVVFYPSRHDNTFSFGPFQLTDTAINEINRFFDIFKRPNTAPPETLDELKDVKNHIRAAAWYTFFNVYNAAKRMDSLPVTKIKIGNTQTLLQKCNSFSSQLTKTGEGKSEFKEFLAGLIGVLHHRPKDGQAAFALFIDNVKDINDWDILFFRSLPKQIIPYNRGLCWIYKVLSERKIVPIANVKKQTI